MGALEGGGPTASQVLVDASAFYRLSLAQLEAMAARAAVLVSPVSLCEILSHLDEPRRREEGQGGAEAVRSDRLRKCDLLQPLAEAPGECAWLPGLAGSLERLRDGTAAAGDAERMQSALDEARRAHAGRSLQFCDCLAKGLGVDGVLSLAGREFVHLAAEGVQGLARKCRGLGLEERALDGAVFSSVYPSAGYRLARAQDRLRQGRGGRSSPGAAGDMEDEHLCGHLHLLERRALVTANAEARSALNRALAELAAASAEVGAEVVALSLAMSVEDALRAFPGA